MVRPLQHACRLALEVEAVPDGFQYLNLLRYLGHGKYPVGKAQRLLGYAPLARLEEYYRRRP